MPALNVACGRIGYEAIGDSDMDGAVAAGSELRVTRAMGASLRPTLAWTGRDLVVVWEDARGSSSDLYLSRLGLDGTVLVDEVRLTSASTTEGYASIAWDGTALEAAWEDARHGETEIYAARFDADGARLGDELRVTTTTTASYDPSVVWTGIDFGISWDEGGVDVADVWLARVDDTGASRGPSAQRTSDNTRSARTALAWNGSLYGVAWEDTRAGNSDAYFGRIAASGALLGGEIPAVAGPPAAEGVALVAAGDRFTLAWEDTRDGGYTIYASPIDENGAASTPVRVSAGAGNARNVSLAWTGRGYGVAWDQGGAILLAELDASGAVTARPQPISGAGAMRASTPSLIWTGSAFAVAWSDRRDGGDDEIYVRVLPR
jgi:hypothetical protein